MEAIVLAGGLGTRLRSAVPDLAKVMAPVCGRPFLEILLTSLAEKGCGRAVLSLGYLADRIQDHFGPRFAGIELAYEIESTPLGTGGALRRALVRCDADHVLVVNGDTYLDLEIENVESRWQRSRQPILIAREVEDTCRYGRLVTAGDRLLGFTEKGVPGRGLINAGHYVLPRDIARFFPATEAFSLESDFLVKAADACPFEVFTTRGQFIDIGVPEDYLRAQTELSRLCT
jgi:D-glycero-alpha-D-manno-heptose 1-phosphate guanylyltransferase